MIVIHKPDERIRKLLKPQKIEEGMDYIPSIYAMQFSHRGERYVFQTITKECLKTELPASCCAHEGYDDLIAAYFLVPRGKDETAFYLEILTLMKAFHERKGFKSYVILPTTACNARCVYCYEDNLVPMSMTPETAEQVVRYILNTRRVEIPVHISWFGGEPLLGMRYIDQISRGLLDAGVEYTSNMITNASLITQEVVDKMRGIWNLSILQVSMDGAEEDYVHRKRYRVYNGDYHRVIEAVNMVSAAGIRVTISCNVDEENLPRIPDYLNDLHGAITHKENVSLFLNPLYQVRNSETDLRLWEKIFSLQQQINAAGFQAAHESQKSLFSLRLYYCIGDRGLPVIAPDGSLYPCEHCPEEYRFGDIWNGVTDSDRKKSFNGSGRLREKCRGCSFLPICTPFANCPVQDRHCADLRRMLLMNSLVRMLEHGGPDGTPPDDGTDNYLYC